jgi:pyruvate dehydrogenase E1 component beta subunit
MWGTAKGLTERFGSDRVIEMPVAENGLTGVAIGAAMAGKRPVINFHRVEFALLAIDQIFNNAAKSHYISRGMHRVPLVIRMVVGRGWGQGPGHSQSLESMFAQIPGLKVVMPTFAADAKALLIGAIADDNPVMFIEHRWLHNATGHVPPGYTPTALDGPRIVRSGRDVTVVSTSYMTLEALRAARFLDDIGVSVEVVDLRVLRPLNLDLVHESVRRTGRIITVDTGWMRFGIGAEIIASIAGRSLSALRSPPARLGLPEHPIPSSRGLVGAVYPDAAGIIAAIGQQLDLPAEKVRAAQDAVAAERGDLPIDVPDPFFKGPF